jgi:hypothetical protein
METRAPKGAVVELVLAVSATGRWRQLNELLASLGRNRR